MLRKQVVRLKNIINSSSGSVLIWGMFFTVFLIFLFMMFFQKWVIHITTDEVSKDITNTLISTASSHLYDSYAPSRDGTSGAYVYNGSSFTEIKDTSKFVTLFTSIYNDTTSSGSTITKKSGDRIIFEVSDIRLFVENANGNNLQSTYMCEYTLTIYNDLLWKDEAIIIPNGRQKVRYKNKF